MKPFNLEDAKAGKPLVTRAGHACAFIAHVPHAAKVTDRVVLYDTHSGEVFTVSECGRYDVVATNVRGGVFMAPVKRELWVARNVKGTYYGGEGGWPKRTSAVTCDTEEEAKQYIRKANECGINYEGPYKLVIEE